MAHVIDLVSSGDEEVTVTRVIPACVHEMTEEMIFQRYDFHGLRLMQLPPNTAYDMYRNEAILAADCEATQSIVQKSLIAQGTRGLFTDIDVEAETQYDYWGMIRLQRTGANVLDD